MDYFTQFATDEKLENEGVYVKAPGNPKGEFLVARIGNRGYAKALTEAIEQNQEALEAKDAASEKLSDDIMASVLASTVLIGWRGEHYSKPGVPLGEYSVEKAKELLVMKDFRKWLAKKADEREQYRAKQEKAEGNV